MRRPSLLVRPLLGLLLGVTAARAEWIWHFDSSAEGWDVVDLHSNGPYDPPIGTYSVSQNVSGGCAGGYISRFDPSSNSFAFSMPLQVLPESQQLSGGRLDFCLRCTHSTWTSEPFVIVVGWGQVLVAAIPLPAPTWSSYSVDLIPENFHDMGGMPVDPALFELVMGQLDALYIMAEYGSTIVETTGLDEVRLRAACTPLVTPVVAVATVGTPELPSLQLSWVAVPGAHSYQVLRLDEPWGGGLSLGVTTGLTWELPVAGDTRAFYRVVARCD